MFVSRVDHLCLPIFIALLGFVDHRRLDLATVRSFKQKLRCLYVSTSSSSISSNSNGDERRVLGYIHIEVC